MSKLTKYTSENYQNFFEGDLSTADTEVYNAINLELQIASSEGLVSLLI